MDDINVLKGMEWGNEVCQYIKVYHTIGMKAGKTTFLGINGPEGIGKKMLIQNISRLLEREFMELDFQDCLKEKSRFTNCCGKNMLVYINDTPIKNGYYDNAVNKFVKENELQQNIIFVFSSTAILGINSAISAKFRVFLFGRLSRREKISYARKVIDEYQRDLRIADIVIADEVIEHVIKYYTKEAGVRSLSVCIRNIIEWMALYNSHDRNGEIAITKDLVTSILGKQKYVCDEMIAQRCLQGIGLAWTNWGGILLPIESIMLEGTGRIIYTGNIGNLMRESVSVVMSYFKANYDRWNIKREIFTEHDFYINIYEQSIYKDGSSAGLAFFTKILCMIKNITFKKAIAFSGEVSLEGRVLRVGGLKEKLCVAQEQGVEVFVLPKQSWLEYQFLSDELKDNIVVYFIDDVMELRHIIQEEAR